MFRIALFLSCLTCATAGADVSIYGTLTPGLKGGTDWQAMYLKEDQMRIDQLNAAAQEGASEDSASSSILIRFAGHPSGILYINHETKRIQMLSSLRGVNAEPSPNAGSDLSANPARVEKRDETREILGYTAQRYDFAFSGNVDPLVLLGQQVPESLAGLISIKLLLSGSSWVVPGMAGADELARFFEHLAERQLTIGMLGPTPPEAARDLSLLSPGLSSALTEVLAQISGEGLPLLTQTRSELKVDMEGIMADMVQSTLEALGMGGQHETESAVTAVDNGNVAAELFYDGGLPKGYSLNTPQ